MALWWLCGGYVFPVVVKPQILSFEVKFDLEGQCQSGSILHLWSKFGDIQNNYIHVYKSMYSYGPYFT